MEVQNLEFLSDSKGVFFLKHQTLIYKIFEAKYLSLLLLWDVQKPLKNRTATFTPK